MGVVTTLFSDTCSKKVIKWLTSTIGTTSMGVSSKFELIFAAIPIPIPTTSITPVVVHPLESMDPKKPISIFIISRRLKTLIPVAENAHLK